MDYGRFLPLLVVAASAMIVLVSAATTDSPHWEIVPWVSKDGHIQSLGEFAVKRYNEQKKTNLYHYFVSSAQKLDRGAGHASYKLVVMAWNNGIGSQISYYNALVLEDLSSPDQLPVLNLASFVPTTPS